MRLSIRFICALLAISALTSAVRAQTTQPTISASIGFSGVFKPESWAPIYVRVSDAEAPRSATLELRTARGKLGHEVVARVSTTRQPTTFTLYAPLGGLDGASLQLRDATGKLLRTLDLAGAAQQTAAANGGPAFAVAGNEADAQRVVSQLINDTAEFAAPGALSPQLLPERVIGYDGIDCLVLPSLEADAIADDVQAAIVSWVRSGGIVMTWPGAQAPTRASPLIDALPATVGLPEAVVFQGLETVGRRLVPREGAVPVGPDLEDPPTVLQRRLGLGQIVMLAFDPTRLTMSATDRIAMWRRLTAGQLAMSADEQRAGVFDPLIAQAVGEQQLQPQAATAREWPRALLSTGLFLGLLLGPAELLLLAAARQHPRTWYTLSGLGLTLGCGLFLLVMPERAVALADSRIDVRVEAPDGLAASAALATAPAEGMAVNWLTSGADPLAQTPSELRLSQRSEGFDVHAVAGSRGGGAKVRATRFAGTTLHPARVNADFSSSLVTNASHAAWDAFAVVSRGTVRIVAEPVAVGEARLFSAAATVAADNASTRRIETGIERLAATPGWAAILMDRHLAQRLVRLLETEETQIVVARSAVADGNVAFTIHVIR